MESSFALFARLRKRKPTFVDLGFAWHVGYIWNKEILLHNGMTCGYSSFIAIVKKVGKGIVILSNSRNRVNEIGVNLLKLLIST